MNNLSNLDETYIE